MRMIRKFAVVVALALSAAGVARAGFIYKNYGATLTAQYYSEGTGNLVGGSSGSPIAVPLTTVEDSAGAGQYDFEGTSTYGVIPEVAWTDTRFRFDGLGGLNTSSFNYLSIESSGKLLFDTHLDSPGQQVYAASRPSFEGVVAPGEWMRISVETYIELRGAPSQLISYTEDFQPGAFSRRFDVETNLTYQSALVDAVGYRVFVYLRRSESGSTGRSRLDFDPMTGVGFASGEEFPAPVPEPSTLGLALAGCLTLGLLRGRVRLKHESARRN